MPDIVLKGITWGHSRGITPLQAASQRYGELHPGIEIQWKKRTLQEFADFPIEELTHHYDLLIIDHPWVGCAAATNCVLPLEEYLPEIYLEDQLNNSVGYSHLSYQYGGHQWALAIDAATPAASYRKDLLQHHNIAIPQRWEEVTALAQKGKVAVPAIPIDMLMNFYSFCIACGNTPFSNKEEVIDEATGITAIEMMKALYGHVDKKMFQYNPIAVAEMMTATDDYWYCPFAYGYSNYSRKGYADNILHYTDVITISGKKMQTTIGGTGLAVSATSAHKTIALDFAQWIVSGNIQSTLYVQHGGQPGYLAAWKDAEANTLTNDYFTSVLPIMENGYIRPRYNGYLHFQDHAGAPLHHCIMNNTSSQKALHEMNAVYRASFLHHKNIAAV
ncbi:MAG: extracellular solute-binding protein [Bacteroidetes bacterium]|nr:extracellular solute-binding protein [Bacteroidota bacterium]